MSVHTCPKCGHQFDAAEDGETVKKMVAVPRVLAEKFQQRFPQHGAWTHAVNRFLESLVELTDVDPEELMRIAAQSALSKDTSDA